MSTNDIAQDIALAHLAPPAPAARRVRPWNRPKLAVSLRRLRRHGPSALPNLIRPSPAAPTVCADADPLPSTINVSLDVSSLTSHVKSASVQLRPLEKLDQLLDRGSLGPSAICFRRPTPRC